VIRLTNTNKKDDLLVWTRKERVETKKGYVTWEPGDPDVAKGFYGPSLTFALCLGKKKGCHFFQKEQDKQALRGKLGGIQDWILGQRKGRGGGKE